MFTAAGLHDSSVFWGILATGLVNFLSSFAGMKLIELLGRRPLIIWPLASITVIMVILTALIVVNVC